MRKYEEYKHSGIDWIPTIPKNWKLRRVDEIAKIVRGNTAFKKDELLDIGKYVALQYGKTYKVDEVNQSFNFYVNDEFYKSNQTVKQGDTILISTSETIEDLGHTCYYNRTDLGLLGGEQLMLRPNTNLISPKFLYYFSKYYRNEIKKYATGLKVFRYNIDDLKNIVVPVFSLSEQQAIANYLDAKTQAIDKKVTLLEQKIETYKQLKRTLINQTITKGLRSLSEVEMKDSGISWIGQIPKHWEVKRFKSFADTIKGKNLEVFDNQIEGALPNLSLEYLRNDSVGFEAFVKTNNRNLIVDENDLVIVWDGAGVGEILNGKVGVISSTIAKLKFNKSVNAKFFSFIRYDLEYRLKQIPTGMGIPHLNPHELKNFICPIPPKSEQEEIANYLDNKTATIDAIVSNMGKQIDTLKQLRKTVINDVVTGKIKVVE